MQEDQDEEMELNRDMKRADLESGSAGSDASSTSSSDLGKSLVLVHNSLIAGTPLFITFKILPLFLSQKRVMIQKVTRELQMLMKKNQVNRKMVQTIHPRWKMEFLLLLLLLQQLKSMNWIALINFHPISLPFKGAVL